MDAIDDLLKETSEKRLPAKNLKYALLALGYFVLARISSIIALDSFTPRSSPPKYWVMTGIYYTLTIVSGVYAFLAFRNSLKSLKTNKGSKNYIALVIGALLLLGICRLILLILS